jgi:hypothetical protein
VVALAVWVAMWVDHRRSDQREVLADASSFSTTVRLRARRRPVPQHHQDHATASRAVLETNSSIDEMTTRLRDPTQLQVVLTVREADQLR